MIGTRPALLFRQKNQIAITTNAAAPSPPTMKSKYGGAG